jgi:23S rRNA pseudouridine1911/1915/1917 synthase
MPKSKIVTEPAPLLAYLFATWPDEKKKQIRTWLKYQAVSVNERPVTQFDHPLKPGDTVTIRSERSAVPKAKLPSGMKIYFEDAAVLVIEKPENLLSTASEGEQEKTAYFQLTEYLRTNKPRSSEKAWIVHRLDRETSGLMVFGKTAAAKTALQAGWDEVTKIYEAVVEGNLATDRGTFRSHLDETSPYKVYSARPSERTREAITHYRVLQRSKGRTLVELTLETGRRHQIRVQLADAGSPIVGDEKYGAKTDPAKRLALHARTLRFTHPVSQQELTFESPLPRELCRLV